MKSIVTKELCKLQDILLYTTVTYCHPDEYLNLFNDNHQDECWQLTVDMIYRFLITGLINTGDSTSDPISGQESSITILKCINELTDETPYPLDLQYSPAWWRWDFYTTSFGKILIEKYKINYFENSVLCKDLIEELVNLFNKNNVSLDKTPLVKIRKYNDHL